MRRKVKKYSQCPVLELISSLLSFSSLQLIIFSSFLLIMKSSVSVRPCYTVNDLFILTKLSLIQAEYHLASLVLNDSKLNIFRLQEKQEN